MDDSSIIRRDAVSRHVRLEVPVLCLLCLMTFIPTFSWMWERFTASGSFYSHGFLIPFLSVFLLWLRRDQLKLVEKRPSVAGLPVVLGGLALNFISLVTEIHFLSGVALIGIILGVSIYLFGFRFTGRICPAVALLIFMVPMPRVFLIDIAFQLQLASAKATAAVLRGVGVQALREGVSIALPDGFTLEVAFACSGLRSIIVFLATAWIIIAMAPRIRSAHALALLAVSLPMALGSNIFRLFLTALAAVYWGYSGTVHTISGFAAFTLYIIIMISISKRILWKEGS